MIKKLLIMWCVVVAALASCDDYDSFTTSADASLRFSSDTISFDTLFATVPSVTKTLIVWNNADKGVRIKDVRLENGANTPFRVNVDGEYLDGALQDLEIRKGDSLFVFAEVTLSESVKDALVFTLENGRQHRVPLTATAMSAEIYKEGITVLRDTTLTADVNRVIYGSLTVAENACLTLEPGTTLYFHTNSTLEVYGQLRSLGTLENMVTLRGDRLDRLFAYLPYDNTVGRWGGVHFHSSSKDNLLTYTDIHSGDFGIKVDTTAVAMDGCIVHNVGGDGLRLVESVATVSNTQFSNSFGDCVAVYGGDSRFVFCTMAQFYPWDARRGNALFIADRMLDMATPLGSLHVSSCLITGYPEDVLSGNLSDPDSAPYYFNHCVIRTPEVNDETHYYDNRWELPKNDMKEGLPLQGSKQFSLFDTTNFLYDFRPLSESIAVNAADLSDVYEYPKDRLGCERVDSVSAGCYQHAR